MYQNKRIFVTIEGIEMQYEAWELIRLFFDASSITFIQADSPLSHDEKGLLLSLRVREDSDKWTAEALFYTNEAVSLKDVLSGNAQPDLRESFEVCWEDLEKPGGTLLKSQKILCGTVLYKLLSDFCGKKLPYGSLTGVRPAKLATWCLEDGLNPEDAVAQLQRVSLMMPHKARILTDVAVRERRYLMDENAVNLYIGIPFCATRCLYCSFTAYPIHRFQGMVDAYLTALEKELLAGAEMLSEMKSRINAIYIGGGTPTALCARDLERLLAMVENSFGAFRCAEYTVEAGRPDTLDQEKLEIIKKSAATRISINPQTMNEDTLRLIGRNHTPEDIVEKFEMARKTGFDNINMDIIAGLPGENLDMFKRTLEGIEALKPDSLTVHTMAVKRASRLKEEQDKFRPTDDAVVEDMIEMARERAYGLRMRPYYLYRQKNIMANLENTGYARSGCECVYNIQTMEERQSIIAFGAGAVSKRVILEENRIERAFNVKEVTQYIFRIDEMIQRKKAIFT